MQRYLLVSMGLLVFTWAGGADERPPVTQPRSTSGDSAVEPEWKERLTVTVGHKDADIVGSTEKPIQAAVDYVARTAPELNPGKKAEERRKHHCLHLATPPWNQQQRQLIGPVRQLRHAGKECQEARFGTSPPRERK